MRRKPTESAEQAMARLQSVLEASRQSPQEEAVPLEMMQVFNDEQWPQLLVEFQPSLRVFSARYDVVSGHRAGGISADVQTTECILRWLVFARGDEQLVRPLDAEEGRAVEMARSGKSFSNMADALWPEHEPGQRQAAMTELLLGWVEEGLVIDVGVPIPGDAEILD